MRHKIFKYVHIFWLGAALLPASCKKFLDAKPEDKYTDEQVFSSRAAIQQTMNGLYTGLAIDHLYGASLTLEAVELIGARYNTQSLIAEYEDIKLNYATPGAPGTTFDAIWSSAYALVLRVNSFIASLEKTRGKGILADAQIDQLTGEAIGIRAFIQFDMLRLYGPKYAGNDDEVGIPYYTVAEGKATPVLSFGEVVDKVLEDLGLAAQLLADDPIRTGGVAITGIVDFFSSYRNRRMNYYAVKALEARVNLYARRNTEAHAAASEVIASADEIFPWTDYNNVINTTVPDRIFSSEVIFGMDNRNLYALQNRYFSASLLPFEMLVPTNDQLESAFEYNENDYRYTLSSWQYSSYGFRTSIKFADLSDQSKDWRYFQPLIRKSEMYYILAETEPDPEIAIQYLNAVRFNRGLPDLTSDAPLMESGGEIEKEYIKEFYGEGQLFFFYKRIDAWWMFDIPAYQVPFPVSETALRN